MSPQGQTPAPRSGTFDRGADPVQPRHPAEAARVASVRALGQLDTGPEEVFDWLVEVAATQTGYPVACITLVDAHRTWIKAGPGRQGIEFSRADSICSWVVAEGRFVEIPDLLDDPRFVHGSAADSGIRSYAGAPLFGRDGMPVGSLCVFDARPRRLDDADRMALERLADLVTGQLLLAAQRRDHSVLPRRRTTTERLRDALVEGEIVPLYQPIVAARDGRTVGCEALVRWDHPTRGRLGPGAFLALAEQDDLVCDLDRAVLHQACHAAAGWQPADGPGRDGSGGGIGVAVNISTRHLATPRLADHVRAALADAHLPPQLLTLELTETALACVDAGGVATLTRLRDLGVEIALDDFGTAYSSLAYLQRFPISCLKIDRAFVAGLADGSRDESLVESILHLAGRLGLQTVAEGVETQAQADLLRDLGCPKLQGFLFSPPLSAPDLRRRLALERSRAAAC